MTLAEVRARIASVWYVHMHSRTSVESCARVICDHKGLAVPSTKDDQMALCEAFLKEPLPSSELPKMVPLKPPSVAMKDAIAKARAYHAMPGHTKAKP